MSAAIEVEGMAFEFWRNRWGKIYDEIGSLASFKLDDFYRQDQIGLILADGQPAALWAHSTFNIAATSALAHTYFKFYGPEFLNWLNQRDIQDVMSLEFFTVAEQYVKSPKSDPSLARAMAGLANKLLLESNAQALIAPARVNVGVAHLAYEIGYECVVPATNQRGFECDLIACQQKNVKPTPHLPSRQLVESLWLGRQDLSTNEFEARNKTLKRAA